MSRLRSSRRGDSGGRRAGEGARPRLLGRRSGRGRARFGAAVSRVAAHRGARSGRGRPAPPGPGCSAWLTAPPRGLPGRFAAVRTAGPLSGKVRGGAWPGSAWVRGARLDTGREAIPRQHWESLGACLDLPRPIAGSVGVAGPAGGAEVMGEMERELTPLQHLGGSPHFYSCF